MKVILLNTIKNLGKLGDQVHVNSGYARNYLIPKGMALFSTQQNILHYNMYQTEIEAKKENESKIIQDRIMQLNMLNHVVITSKAGKQGKLFGSITSRDIANAINLAGIKIYKHEIYLPNGSLRTLGNHNIIIKIHKDISINFTIIITSHI